MASAAVHTMTPTVRAQVNTLYGITEDDLVRSWLNPKEQAPILRKRLASAQIAAEGLIAGFGQVAASQAERLYETGYDQDKAREAFAKLVQQRELFAGLQTGEENIDVEGQIGLLAGDQATLTEVTKRAQRRVGRFQEGGGFATSNEGVVGLRSASTP
jgi:hypothetical protein